jgi:hypothetical protein
MDSPPNEGQRVTVPFNEGGGTRDAPGSVVRVRELGVKRHVVVRLESGEEVDYPLEAVQPIEPSDAES